jgi:murein DD-endopeptidase MepM/ murein hydrolase activator NlpD
MLPLVLALALAGPVVPDDAVSHAGRCRGAAEALADLTASDLDVPVVDDGGGIKVVDSFRSRRSGGRIHKATDILAPRGMPVVALDDGIVVGVRDNRLGGRVIEQLDATGCVGFYYAHLDRYADGIVPGAVVRRGDLLGFVGDTGNARGTPHLHLGTYFLGARPGRFSWDHPLNPHTFLVPREDS